MIKVSHPYFVLGTKDLHYIFRILETGQLEHLYVGKKLIDQTYEALHTKITAGMGSQILYERDDYQAYLDLLPLEYSGIGKGDFRLSPLEIKCPDGTYVNDFIYHHHTIKNGFIKANTMPTAHAKENEAQSLVITLIDEHAKLELDLIYTTFDQANVITRRAVLHNKNTSSLVIRKIMSMMMDLDETDVDLYTLDGGWIKEAHQHKRELTYGTYIIDSTTGTSSNRHNPGIILAKKDTTENHGVCIGINLVYSGNHYEAVQIANHGMLRVMTGINPHCFEWVLNPNDAFETPEAVLSYADQGFNELSQHFHDFVNHHITPAYHQKRSRPIVLNSWEAFYFNFNHRKLLHLANQAKDLGIELFVLDDGWFGDRNDDQRALGDYTINKKKLPYGLKHLADKIHQKGLQFGLWFEPEMISPNSQLYRLHPEYAIHIEGRRPSLGRNQLVLDLCNPEVRGYILDNLHRILKEIPIDYIKWDMNRQLTDMYSAFVIHQGMFFHAYMIGLYSILQEMKDTYPHILIETCSSGGNRFDLGMLTFGAQIWTSDDTDPIERLKIQEGLSYLYPLSTISAHVSLAPHAQTLRDTPLSTRFNVASFGVHGYELNFDYVSPVEKKEIKRYIQFYREHRDLFQFGTLIRHDIKDDHHIVWQVTDGKKHVIASFQTLAEASPEFEKLHVQRLDSHTLYHLKSFQQRMPLKRFGHLISHALPIKLNTNGWIMRKIGEYKMLDNAVIDDVMSGEVLKNGYRLKQQFSGTYYNQETRIIGDFGSMMYVVEPLEEEHDENI